MQTGTNRLRGSGAKKGARAAEQAEAAAVSGLDTGHSDLDTECVVCCEVERSVVLLPCAHLVLCEGCWQLLQDRSAVDCPICRAVVEEHILIRMT